MTKKLEISTSEQQGVGPFPIFRVLENIREHDPKAYRPTVASIGPLCGRYFDPLKLDAMDNIKWRCIRQLLARHGDSHEASKLFHACLLEMKTLESDSRRYYPMCLIDCLPSDKFAEILLLDGCFIILLLMEEWERNNDSTSLIENWSKLPVRDREDLVEIVVVGDQLEETVEECGCDRTGDHGLFIAEDDEMSFFVCNLWMRSLLKYDLLKLENQIPFYVIETLYNRLRTPRYRNVDLVVFALNFFSSLHPKVAKMTSRIPSYAVEHLLHLFHISLFPQSLDNLLPCENKPPTAKVPEWIPSATELHAAGVKFRRKENASSFLEIEFHEGVMEIPPLNIYDYSNSIFRNLMAFEQGFPVQPYITIYMLFMACMTRTEKDAKLLQLKGILLNGQGSDEEFSCFFNRLCGRLHYSYQTDYLWDLFIQVRRYHECRWRKWRASFVRCYLDNPWMVVSIASGALLLLLTIEQSFFAAFSYLYPRNQ